MNYFIAVRDEQKGPYTRSQLETMWQTGVLTADALYCAEGMNEWRKIEELMQATTTSSAGGQPTSAPLPPLSDRVKKMAGPAFSFVRLHAHRIIITGALTVFLIVALRFVFWHKSLFSASISLQGLFPIWAVGGNAFTQILSMLFTLAITTGLFVVAWRTRRVTMTAVFCVFVYLSAALGIERNHLVDGIFALRASAQSKMESPELTPEQEQVCQILLKGWQQNLNESKQSICNELLGFSPTVTTIEINDLAVEWKSPTGTQIATYTMVYTFYWKGYTKDGHTKVRAVFEPTGRNTISLRVVESSGATKKPIGTELVSE